MAQWYYTVAGQKHGPVSSAALVGLARQGKLKPTDTIWREGMRQWVPAGRAKGLFSPVRAAAPPTGKRTNVPAPAEAARPAGDAAAGPLPAGAPQVSRKTLIVISAVAGGVVILGAVAGVLMWLLLPGAVERAMEYAPPGAFGIIHINYSALADDMVKEARKLAKDMLKEGRKRKDDLGGLSDADLDEMEKAYRKVDSVDLFVLDTKVEPPLVAAIRTSLTPDELINLPGPFGAWCAGLKKGDNGRYDSPKGGLRLIFGAEASDLDRGIVLLGLPELLTEELVGELGTGENEELRKVLRDVDTSLPAWGAFSFHSVDDKEAPKKMVLALDPRGEGRGQAAMTFEDEKYAEKAIGEITAGAAGSIWADFLSFEQEGKVITAKLKPKGPFIPRVLVAIEDAKERADRSLCGLRLHSIGMEIARYQEEFNYDYPPDLATLVKRQPALAEDLKCRSAGGERTCDYFYLPPEGSGHDGAIMACDFKDNHAGKGRNVLEGTGFYPHARWMTEDAFQEELKKPINARFAAALREAEGQ
ncbi:MAG: DUF4339 domain-containing protein [Planctomycetota bacterium]